MPVISVVVAVAVCRLQLRRVSVHAVADGKQKLESRIRPVVELGQTAITCNVYCNESQVLKSANV